MSHDPFPLPDRPQAVSRRRGSTAQQRIARRRRARRRRRTALAFTLVIAVLAGMAVAAGGHLRDLLGGFGGLASFASAADFDGPGDERVQLEIPPGSTGAAIGRILHEAEVVASVAAFTAAFSAHPGAAGIQPGFVELLTRMSAADAVDKLAQNNRLVSRVTIPEGFRVDQVLDRLEAQTHLTRADLDAAAADPGALGLPDEAEGELEGWLFPATYTLPPDETATGVLSSMVRRTIQELDRAGVPEQDRTRVLNIAALIEREVRHDADLPRVARAIENRLDQGMRLQIDAAVAYGLGISGTQLTRAHLADATNPFNTYQHAGLPPTPIANPGAAAIDAAMNPADGPYIFWVTINLDTGETVFTATYAEHQYYVAHLRAWQAANQG